MRHLEEERTSIIGHKTKEVIEGLEGEITELRLQLAENRIEANYIKKLKN